MALKQHRIRQVTIKESPGTVDQTAKDRVSSQVNIKVTLSHILTEATVRKENLYKVARVG